MSKILVDTNVLIYSIDEDSKYFEKVHEFLSQPNIELFITSKNISEFLSVMTRIPKSPLTIESALLVVKDFNKMFQVLYPTTKSYSLFLRLIQKYHPRGLQIHDFEIISIALANSITTLATFNKKDFEKVKEIELLPFL
jgi:predicted nucleic acid-binding protein